MESVLQSLAQTSPLLALLLFAVGYLYRDNQKLHRERLDDHKAHTQSLLSMQSSTLTTIQGATTALGSVQEMLEERDSALDGLSTSLTNGAKNARRTKP